MKIWIHSAVLSLSAQNAHLSQYEVYYIPMYKENMQDELFMCPFHSRLLEEKKLYLKAGEGERKRHYMYLKNFYLT